jgi:hypothetical protein
MTTDLERLDEADAIHDGEPARGAELLRAIDPARLPPNRWPGYAFLLNHVFGEKLGLWSEALQRQHALIAAARPEPALVLWRQAAAAAVLAGATQAVDEYTAAFAQASGAPAARCTELLQLNAVMFRASGLDAAQAGEETLAALAPLALPAWQAPSPLDASVAACANNIASGLLDRPATELRHGPARAALVGAAEQAQRFWQRAGTWVHHERALYLRAMVCNALGEHADARSHTLAALALLDAHDTDHAEDVDRAFLELERWHACARLGAAADAEHAARRARALADSFDDASLNEWFTSREQALKDLPAA